MNGCDGVLVMFLGASKRSAESKIVPSFLSTSFFYLCYFVTAVFIYFRSGAAYFAVSFIFDTTFSSIMRFLGIDFGDIFQEKEKKSHISATH